MKKILILANNDVGLYKFRKELIIELLKENEVYISLPYGELVDPLIELGCHFIDTPVDRRGMNPLTDIRLMNHYKHILKDIHPDLVITYTIKPNLYGGLMCRNSNIPYVVNITGLGTTFQKENLLKKFVCTFYKKALKKVKVVLFENETNRDIFVQNKLVPITKTHVLSGAGVNLQEYPFVEYPATDQDIHFLFIGRVMKEKGIDEFLEVASIIKKERKDIHFDIVGPMEDNYTDIINEYHNKDIIHYYGFQEDVKPFIKQAHCFVLPSYHEGMANTLLESASMGRPLLCSDIPGCKEAILDNGYTFKSQDSKDLLKVIREFIELPYNTKVELGINSRRYMEKKFDKKIIVEETLKQIGF